MFFYTDTADAPWTIIKSDDKKRARLNCMQHFLSQLDYPDKNQHVVHGPDPLIVGSSSQVIEKTATSGVDASPLYWRRSGDNRRRSASAFPRRSAVNSARPGREQR